MDNVEIDDSSSGVGYYSGKLNLSKFPTLEKRIKKYIETRSSYRKDSFIHYNCP